MVHVVPPIQSPADTATPGNAAMASPAVAAPLVVPPSASPEVADLEQIAAEAASLLPDETLRAAVPPPLPAVAASHELVAGSSTVGGSTLVAASAAALVCVAAITWGAWMYVDDETSDLARSNSNQNVSHPDNATHTSKDTSPDDALQQEDPIPPSTQPDDGSGQRGTPRGAVATTQPPAESKDTQAPSADPTTTIESASQALDISVAPPIDDIPAGTSENPPVPNDLPQTDERAVRKPSLEMQELPKVLVPIEATAVESAGQITVEAHNADAADALPARHGDEPPAAAADEPPLKRIAPRTVDVSRQLATRLVAVEFTEAPLHVLLQSIADLAGTPISLDADALYVRGVSVDRLVTVTAQATTAAAVLEQSLAPLGLVTRTQQGQLLVTASPAPAARKARYAVDDLVRSGDPPIAELIGMLHSLLNPHGDQQDAARLQLDADDGAIFLAGDERDHDRMIEICEKLRVARGRPLRSRYSADARDARFDPRRFELTSRRAKAQELLERLVTAGIGQPAPLREIVAYLARQTGAVVLIDGPALAAAGMSIETEARLRAADAALDAALEELLEPLGLTFRPVAPGVLEITTPEAAALRECIEFYSLRGVLSRRTADPEAVAQFSERLAKAAGIDSTLVRLVFDPPSQFLIVAASYSDQVRLERAIPAIVDGIEK
jgi:hypothetical protein